jgi:hypothetical protein
VPNDEEMFDGPIGAVRIGETVRKPSGPWTPTVQAMLAHLRASGLGSVPQPLGTDGDGREMMSFLPGQVASRPWPPILKRLEGVRLLAAWLRDFHESISTFRPEEPVWRAGAIEIRDGEIALHGDFGPWNTVWDADKFVGVIDWDLAEPGPAIMDVAFLALQVVPLRDDGHAARAGLAASVPRQARLHALCSAYGGVGSEEVVERIEQLHARDLERTIAWGADGIEPWATFRKNGDEAIIRADQAWLQENRLVLLS